MKFICLLIAVCVVWSVTASASAQGYYSATPNTLRLMGGVAFTDGGDFANDIEYLNDDLGYAGIKLGDANHSVNLALAWERQVSWVLALGLEGQFDRISSKDDVYNEGLHGEVDLTGTGWAVLANAVLTPTPNRNVYFGAGAGIAYARVTENLREEDQDLVGAKATAWAPTFQGFVGLVIPMGPKASMGIQGTYRFRNIKMDEATGTIEGKEYQSFDLSDDKFKFDLSGPVVSVVFSHRL